MDLRNGKAQTSGLEQVTRLHQSWIQGFKEYTKDLPTPELFRTWAGLSAVSMAMGRKVWTQTRAGRVYPNMFTLLVAPPAVGKSIAIRQIANMLRATELVNLAPDSVSYASLVDSLAMSAVDKDITAEKAVQQMLSKPINREGGTYMGICASEFGVLCPENNLQFMNVLNILYDCEDVYEERKRTTLKDGMKIDRPGIGLIAGIQPGFMSEVFNDKTFQMGFASRLIFAYADEIISSSMFEGEGLDPEKLKKLIRDLTTIASLTGEMKWTLPAQQMFDFIRNDQMPHSIVDNSNFIHYNGRRPLHLMKLVMNVSAGRTNTLEVTEDDVGHAFELLKEVEAPMGKVVQGMEYGADQQVQDDTFKYVFRLYMASDKKPVALSQIKAFLSRKVPVNMLDYTARAMINTNMLRVVESSANGIPLKVIPLLEGERHHSVETGSKWEGTGLKPGMIIAGG
jgi:hypothetical protein